MRTTWILALLALAAAVVLAATSCTSSAPAALPVPDAPTCAAPGGCAAPTRVKVVNPLGGAVEAGWVPDFTAAFGTSRGCMRSVDIGARFAVPLTLEEGDRMLSLTIAIEGNGISSAEVFEVSATPAGVIAAAIVLPIPNVPMGWHDFAVDLVDTTVSGGVSHWFEVLAEQPGACVGALRLAYTPVQ